MTAAHFYETPLGRMAAAFVWQAVSRHLPKPREGQRTLIIGNGLAYADWLQSHMQGQTILAFLDGAQAAPWPDAAAHQVCVAAADALPFGDVVFDCVVVIHGLEFAPVPEELMHEINRVLAADGTVVLVAPNRWGLWPWFHHTPWGDGRTFSPRQLRQLFHGVALAPEKIHTALFVPPLDCSRYAITRGAARYLEKIAGYLGLGCGGVVIGTARKLRYAASSGGGRTARVRARMALATNPTQRQEETNV